MGEWADFELERIDDILMGPKCPRHVGCADCWHKSYCVYLEDDDTGLPGPVYGTENKGKNNMSNAKKIKKTEKVEKSDAVEMMEKTVSVVAEMIRALPPMVAVYYGRELEKTVGKIIEPMKETLKGGSAVQSVDYMGHTFTSTVKAQEYSSLDSSLLPADVKASATVKKTRVILDILKG